MKNIFLLSVLTSSILFLSPNKSNAHWAQKDETYSNRPVGSFFVSNMKASDGTIGIFLPTSNDSDSIITTSTKSQFNFNISKSGVDSTVTAMVNGVLYNLPYSAAYDSGQTVTVTIIWGEGVDFRGWTGTIVASTSTITFTMDGSKSLNANFQYLPTRRLTINKQGLGNGYIKVNDSTFALPYSGNFNLYRTVKVEEFSDSLSLFKGWSGDTTYAASLLSLNMYKNITLNVNLGLKPNLIQIAAPNGGENWAVGTTHQILWTSPLISEVKIDFSTNAGFNWFSIDSNIPGGSRSYDWTIPDNTTSQAKIRITDVSNNAIMDTSDALFTISEPIPPAAITSPASNITSNSAQLNGSLNPNGLSSKFKFEYGIDTSYGSSTNQKDAGNGYSAIAVRDFISGLYPNTIYHFRIISSNVAGTVIGNDLTFTTKDTIYALKISLGGNGNGYIKINGSQVSLPISQNFNSGSIVKLEALPVVGFSFIGWKGDTVISNNPVYIRMNSDKELIAQFDSAYGKPVVSTDSSKKLSDNSEILYGTVNPNGLSTHYNFEFGTDTNYGFNTTPKDIGSGIFPKIVSDTVQGLNSNKQYHYRITAINSADESFGYDSTFIITVVSVNHENINATKFLLSQNYPNPFNPATVINYSVPQTSFVTIKVYDILGNEVATLVNEEKKAGNYSTELAVGNMQLTSGVYFYRMHASTGSASGYVETKKLILLK